MMMAKGLYRDELYQKSIEIIKKNQDKEGAYLASPTFPTYHYSWFRDGAFIAYAMDLAGEHESAASFHFWAANQINRRAELVERAVKKARDGQPLIGSDYLHTRYTLGGMEEEAGDEEWPNFQLDGFGTWLWALEQHSRFNSAPLPKSWLQAAGLTARYLEALWKLPCFDCWEEFPEHVHPYTLGAIYGGLAAHSRITKVDHADTLTAIKQRIINDYTYDGHFVKFSGDKAVDASLLGLAVPYGVISPEDPSMLSTAVEIENTLLRGGGLHRYARDTYYGGGEWILLTAWMGWYYTCLGSEQSQRKALEALDWIHSKAGPEGSLPEQTPASLNHPDYFEPWVKKWGPIANPLLWSHAKLIILAENLMK
jgi:GH15 family glucan-1,4-alpha-glucosidase